MKNREKFEKEIMDIACSGHSIAFDKEANKLTACNKINCSECVFCSIGSTTNCLDKIKEWCESEYKEAMRNLTGLWEAQALISMRLALNVPKNTNSLQSG